MTIMQIEQANLKATIAVAWVLTWGVLAVSLNLGSASNWILFIGSAALPPLMLLTMWNQPAQTMSESIHEALK